LGLKERGKRRIDEISLGIMSVSEEKSQN